MQTKHNFKKINKIDKCDRGMMGKLDSRKQEKKIQVCKMYNLHGYPDELGILDGKTCS